MICIPIVGKTRDAMAADLHQAAAVADLAELRMDYAPAADLEALLRNRPCPVIVTNRPQRQGGMFHGSEDQRIALLQKAMDLGAEYVDIELDSISRIRKRGNTRLIVSHHDFHKTPEDLDRIHAEIVRAGADIAKVVCMALDIRDNLRVFDLLQRAGHPTIALCMGELGLITRVLGKKFGNILTFASLTPGKESAPGQLAATDLAGLYRYKKIGPHTAIYGVIANPVAHSMSPAIHNAAFEEVGLDAIYVPFKVQGDPAEFVNAFRGLPVQGYSVTIPHKQAVIPAMDEVDDLVKKTGALNTIVNRNGRLLGTNTDVTGALQALEHALEADSPQSAQREEMPSLLKGTRVLLLGAGGAARALAHGLLTRSVTLTIANRTVERGRGLAKEIGCDFSPLPDIAPLRADVLINTTSVGMHPNVDETPVPREALRHGMLVFDAVYNPPETRLLREARQAGCRTLSGIAWFVNQAALQFELWTGQAAPRPTMERVIRARLAKPA